MLSPRVPIMVEITSPHMVHSINPSPAALRRCPFTIMQVLRDCIVISTILAAQMRQHTSTGGNDDKNSDMMYSPYIFHS